MDCSASPRDSILLVVGMQDRALARLGSAGSAAVLRTRHLLSAAGRAGVPVVVVRTTDGGAGPAVLEDACRAAGATVMDHAGGTAMTPAVLLHLEGTRRRRVVVTGTDTHAAVFLTARDAHQEGFITLVPHDACAARRPADHDVALHLCRQAGAAVTTVDTLLHEWLLPAHATELHQLLQEAPA